MKAQGYDTYMTGKWHVHHTASEIFDITGNVRAGVPKQNNQRYDRKFNEGLSGGL